MTHPCTIIRYHGGRNDEIAALILDVQRTDVGLDVPIEEQPELLDIAAAYDRGAFWLALDAGKVVGTVGILGYGNAAILKKLFVHRDHRGRTGVAHPLHDAALDWVRSQNFDAILLDTPAKATRSHAFYRAKGYHIVERAELPDDYSFPDRDSTIFKLEITQLNDGGHPAVTPSPSTPA